MALGPKGFVLWASSYGRKKTTPKTFIKFKIALPQRERSNYYEIILTYEAPADTRKILGHNKITKPCKRAKKVQNTTVGSLRFSLSQKAKNT